MLKNATLRDVVSYQDRSHIVVRMETDIVLQRFCTLLAHIPDVSVESACLGIRLKDILIQQPFYLNLCVDIMLQLSHKMP